ncbi:sulfotransferase family protein [Arenimonas alkanexedens]
MTEPTPDLLAQAAALHRQGRRAEAIDLFKQVLAEKPDAAEGWYELGYLLRAEGRYAEAFEAYGEALARGVRRPAEVHLNRAALLSDFLRRDDEAEAELRAALAAAPDYLPAQLNLGNLHEERGEREQALACYQQILSGPPGADKASQELRYEALARTVNLHTASGTDDPLLAQANEAAGKVVGNLTVRANLLFALGRAYERLAAHDLAFDAYARGNRSLVRQSGRSYDRAHQVALTDALIAAFPAAAAKPATTAPGPAPLFVLGMFRSGSTLVEQVLAAHPQVTPGGELEFLPRLAAQRLAPFPASVAGVDDARWQAFADEYRAELAQRFPQGQASRYLTDKRPDNFQLAGLIKRLFPDAKIIHTLRDPMDTGLSVFTQHLNLRVAGYSADLGDIGHHYGQYRRLMAHWKSLYGDDILDFDYDAFVREPRPALEKLLAFLGLDWDDGCLQFHTLSNTVKTASYWQVRQPLNTKASGRWRPFGEHLAPLRTALREAGVDAG